MNARNQTPPSPNSVIRAPRCIKYFSLQCGITVMVKLSVLGIELRLGQVPSGGRRPHRSAVIAPIGSDGSDGRLVSCRAVGRLQADCSSAPNPGRAAFGVAPRPPPRSTRGDGSNVRSRIVLPPHANGMLRSGRRCTRNFSASRKLTAGVGSVLHIGFSFAKRLCVIAPSCNFECGNAMRINAISSFVPIE